MVSWGVSGASVVPKLSLNWLNCSFISLAKMRLFELRVLDVEFEGLAIVVGSGSGEGAGVVDVVVGGCVLVVVVVGCVVVVAASPPLLLFPNTKG